MTNWEGTNLILNKILTIVIVITTTTIIIITTLMIMNEPDLVFE